MKSAKFDLKDKKSLIKAVVAFVVLAVLLVLAGTLIKNAADISRLNTQLEEAQSKYNQQLEENSSLKAILDSEDKNDYIEEQARDEGYIKDGEIVLHDVGD